MSIQHQYHTAISWTGNKGSGTSHYTEYERSHDIQIDGKPTLLGSADAPFRGDITKHNPEDLLLASLSSCHMLWYLHLCADAGIIVTAYTDQASGTLLIPTEGSGHFSEVLLQPVVTISNTDKAEEALTLHEKAHEKCFIANSVNFPVSCKAAIIVKS
jgi:organic hydroperoxide reductase OsmC/OhrA